MKVEEYEFLHTTISGAGPTYNNPKNNFVVVSWAVKGIGFGEMTIVQNKEGGPAKIASECMGKEFCKALLMKLVDDAEIVE